MFRALTRLLVLIATLIAAPVAEAQAPLDYQRLFAVGGGQSQTEEPQQSRPAAERPQFDPSSVPPAEAYGALTGQPVAGEDLLARTQRVVEAFRQRLVAIVVEAPRAFSELWVTLAAASRTGEPAYFLGVAIFAWLLIAVGRAVSNLFSAFVARPLFVAQQRADPKGYREKLPVLAYRVMLTLIGAFLATATAASVGIFFYDGHVATLDTVLIIFACYAAGLVIDTIWRMMLCPFLPPYRLPAIDTREARRLYRWLVAVSMFGIGSIGFGYWVKALGLPREVLVLFSVTLSAIMVAGILLMMRTNAASINRIILDGQPRSEVSWVTLIVLALWAPLGMLYLVASWGKFAVDMVMGFRAEPLGLMVPYLVMLGGTIIYALMNYGIERAFSRSRRMGELNARPSAPRADSAGVPRAPSEPPRLVAVAEDGTGEPPGAEPAPRTARPAEFGPALDAEMRREDFGSSGDIDGDGSEEGSAIRSYARPTSGQETHTPDDPGTDDPADTRPRFVLPRKQMRSFEELARRIASLFAIGAGAYGLLYYWGGGEIFAESMMLGILEDVIDLVFVGYILFHAVRIWIDRKIAEEGVDEQASAEPGEGEGGTGASRLATLLPLVRSFVLGLIVIAILLAVATEIGLNVAPLFAGAGILGLAVGFGSQTLVRDILSGAFFLMDDAFRRGEYIDVGEVKGTVEKISLRSFQLRHHLGMLHTIPFGEIKHLTNYSRDWVMMKLPLRLTYDTDVDRVRRLVKKLGQELLEDEQIGDKFLQPLKSQGVIEMQDSAMIIRVKFMTKPGEQWVIRKRVFQEIRALFEREGIKFAHREVTVRIPDLEGRDAGPVERQAVGAATRTALDVIESEQQLASAGAGRGPMDDR